MVVEEAAAISVVEGEGISVVEEAAAISLGLRGIVLAAIASYNIKERTSRGTEIISGTMEISFLEIPSGMITHTTDMIIRTTGMIIRTMAIMTTMPVTIPMDNPHQPKCRLLRRPLLPCSR